MLWLLVIWLAPCRQRTLSLNWSQPAHEVVSKWSKKASYSNTQQFFKRLYCFQIHFFLCDESNDSNVQWIRRERRKRRERCGENVVGTRTQNKQISNLNFNILQIRNAMTHTCASINYLERKLANDATFIYMCTGKWNEMNLLYYSKANI